MNPYQQKWTDILQGANVPGWKIEPAKDDILITVPGNQNIKELADKLETVIAELSLDISLPKERLRFIISNGREEVDYLINPAEEDLNTGKM